MVGMTRPGAYAEFMSIPAASLIAMPQDMAARDAALTEPAAPRRRGGRIGRQGLSG